MFTAPLMPLKTDGVPSKPSSESTRSPGLRRLSAGEADNAFGQPHGQGLAAVAWATEAACRPGRGRVGGRRHRRQRLKDPGRHRGGLVGVHHGGVLDPHFGVVSLSKP